MDRGNMVSNIFRPIYVKRAAFILGGLALGIATSEIVHRIYIDDPYFEWNGLLQLFWFVIMLIAFLLVGYGIILKN